MVLARWPLRPGIAHSPGARERSHMSTDDQNDTGTFLTLNQTSGEQDEKLPTGHVLYFIEGKHHAVSSQLANYANRRKSLLAKLFPTDLDKVLADGQLNAARTACEFNNRMLSLACSMKYGACKETADTWLKSLKVDNRSKFFVFVTAKLLELGETIETRRTDFAEHIGRRYAHAKQYESMPEFHARYLKSIDKETDDTLLWLDELLSQFRGIVQERITQFDQTALSSP
jgi:hypothetical protein